MLSDDGTWPTSARFTFDRPLDDPSLVFLVWLDGRFQQHSWQEVGTAMTFAPEPGSLSVLAP